MRVGERLMRGGPMDGHRWRGELVGDAVCIVFTAPHGGGETILHYHADVQGPDAYEHHLCVVEVWAGTPDHVVYVACAGDPDDVRTWELIGSGADALRLAHERAAELDRPDPNEGTDR